MSLRVVIDACVLLPISLCDVLLTLADAELYEPRWSEQILDEVARNLVEKFGFPEAKAARQVGAMTSAFPDGSVEDYETLTPEMMNDPKDRHVLAAAVRARASLIVTANLKDFPDEALALYEIEAVHPDDFLLDLLDVNPEAVWAAVERKRASNRSPPMGMVELADRLSSTVRQFAEKLREASRAGALGATWASSSPRWPSR